MIHRIDAVATHATPESYVNVDPLQYADRATRRGIHTIIFADERTDAAFDEVLEWTRRADHLTLSDGVSSVLVGDREVRFLRGAAVSTGEGARRGKLLLAGFSRLSGEVLKADGMPEILDALDETMPDALRIATGVGDPLLGGTPFRSFLDSYAHRVDAVGVNQAQLPGLRGRTADAAYAACKPLFAFSFAKRLEYLGRTHFGLTHTAIDLQDGVATGAGAGYVQGIQDAIRHDERALEQHESIHRITPNLRARPYTSLALLTLGRARSGDFDHIGNVTRRLNRQAREYFRNL